MSGEAPLVGPIEGYVITVTDQNTDEGDVILEMPLRLNKVGGAHVVGAEGLITVIEDAVFNAEHERETDD